MLRLGALFLLAALTTAPIPIARPLASQPPDVGTRRGEHTEQAEATNHPNVAGGNRHTPNKPVASPNFVFSPNITVKADAGPNGSKDEASSNYVGYALAAVGAFIAFLTYLSIRKQANLMVLTLGQMKIDAATRAKETSDQIQLARDEFNATHRPKIYIRNVALGEPFKQGPEGPRYEVKGRFIIVNSGGTTATIVAGYLEVCWSDSGIFPEYIYETKSKTDTTKTVIKPGEFFAVDFVSGTVSFMAGTTGKQTDSSGGSTTILGRVVTTGYILKYGSRPTLYVLGWLRFKDESGIARQMGFCRQWVESEATFRAVDDPDYEYEA